MSSYMHFFARSDHDDFIQIDCFSRNNTIYRKITEVITVPYEKIDLVRKEGFRECANIAQGYIELIKDRMKQTQKRIELIGTFNNSVSEKIEAVNYYSDSLLEDEQELDENIFAQNFFIMLQNIQAPIYVGIDCGSKVTIKDIKEE